MAVTITINGTDKSNTIDWRSIKKVEILTRQPDTLSFRIKNYGTKTYLPVLNDEVIMLDGATRIFAGLITEIRQEIDGLAKYHLIMCKDYTQLLDRQLVSKTYTAQTVSAIVADIISTYTTGFTVTNVVGTDTVQKIVFNYMTVSQALQKLSETLGNYDWYVDYNKDIHFFPNAYIVAPFTITDSNQNLVWNSLKFDQVNHQIRNDIIVRGGTVNGTAVDNIQIVDGTQRIFFVGYNLDSFLAYKALAASPTTFVALTVGADGKDDPTAYDTLYNPNRGLLTFPDSTKPAVNDRFKYTGTPVYPLIAEQKDTVSITTYGTYQYVIVDTTIKSRAAASQRARAELLKYSNPLKTANFETHVSGLLSGQTITINSTVWGVNTEYKIQQITTTLRTFDGSSLKFEVDCVSTESLNMVDILNKLLVKDVSDQIEIGQNEVVDLIYSALEEITIGESVAISLTHNPQAETITLTEATNSALNAGTIFVAGPYTPSGFGDTKRVFVLNGSLLG